MKTKYSVAKHKLNFASPRHPHARTFIIRQAVVSGESYVRAHLQALDFSSVASTLLGSFLLSPSKIFAITRDPFRGNRV